MLELWFNKGINKERQMRAVDGQAARATGQHLAAMNDEAEREARLRLVNQEHADFKTRAARAEIKKLAQYMSAPQVISILCAMVNAFEASLELRTSVTAQNALDSLLDAISVLEDGEEA